MSAIHRPRKRLILIVFLTLQILISSQILCRLSVSVGALYVRRYFDEGVRERVFEMVENIRASFIAMLHDVAWMDEETKKKAIKKAEALIPHIAYPDELTDDKKIEEFYSDLEELKADEYLMNALRLNHFKVDYVFKRLRVANNKTDWVRHATPAVINAFYSAFENSIRKWQIQTFST